MSGTEYERQLSEIVQTQGWLAARDWHIAHQREYLALMPDERIALSAVLGMIAQALHGFDEDERALAR